MTQSSKKESQIVSVVAAAMSNKKASDIHVLDMRKIEAAVCDYFIICTANSSPQLDAVMDEVDSQVKKQLGEDPIGIEGKDTDWLLMDYADVVVHIFKPEAREFYKLEDLWSDAKIQTLD